MRRQQSSSLQGWILVAWAAVVVATTVIVIALTTADHIEAIRSVMRATARYAVVAFLLAFTAGPLFRFWPNAWTRWQRQNRRYLGVSFAVAHLTHLAAILTLRNVAPQELADVPAITWIFGGLAYAFVVAMTFTSFDRTAAWLGPRAWTILHTTGSYYVWLIFANSYIPRAVIDVAYAPFALMLAAALLLRIASRIAQSRAQTQSALVADAKPTSGR